MSRADLTATTTTNTTDVTVIIPTHNRAALLEAALDSVLAQDFAGTMEIIVVDDQSQDDTVELVRRYPQVKLIQLAENVGAYAARNCGIQAAQGRYLAFLDSDDLWQPDYLTTQLAALAGSDRQFAVSDVVIWRVASNQHEINQQQPNLQRYGSIFHHLLVGGSFICTPSSVVMPRALFTEVGWFDQTVRIAGDTEFYLRCLLAGYTPLFTWRPLVIWREHGNQLTHRQHDDLRMQGRLQRADRYYAQIAQRVAIVPLAQIQADIYLTFAGKACVDYGFGRWLMLSLHSTRYTSWRYTLGQMLRQLKRLLRRKFPESFLQLFPKLFPKSL